MLLQLFVLFVASFGFVQIIIDSSILARPRKWMLRNSIYLLHLPKMIFCVLCLGFWVGVVTSIYLFSPARSAFCGVLGYDWIYIAVDGFISSAIVYFMYTIQSKLES